MNTQAQHRFAVYTNVSVLDTLDARPAFATAGSRPMIVTREDARLLESREGGMRFVRGSMTGLALEVAAAMCLYGLWEVGHLFR
jgi:hypothetical protein